MKNTNNTIGLYDLFDALTCEEQNEIEREAMAETQAVLNSMYNKVLFNGEEL
jgi:hypothetical protein